MTQSIKLLRVVQFAMLVSIVLYVFVGERVSTASFPGDKTIYFVLAGVGVTLIATMFAVQRSMVVVPGDILRVHQDDLGALARWRAGYIVTYALCEAVAMFGLILRIMGWPLEQVWPFYLSGAALLLFFRPRLP